MLYLFLECILKLRGTDPFQASDLNQKERLKKTNSKR